MFSITFNFIMTHKNTQTFHNICIDLNITYFIIPAYPRATRCGGDIVMLLWFRGSVRHYTLACFFVKLGRHVNHGERMIPIDFGGQRSKVKGQGKNGYTWK